MEKNDRVLKLLIWVLLFVVLIAGAYALYNRLRADVLPMDLVTETTQSAPEDVAAETTQAAQEDVAAETTQAAQENLVAAPDFTVYDLEGNAYKLSDFKGKPVILNFWASWCGPCKMEMPDIQLYYETYGDQIHFLIVNLTDGYQETVETASAYLAEEGYTFPVYYDTDIEAAMAYGVNAVPVTYFINAEGYLLARFQGAMPAQILRQGVGLLLPQE